MKHPDYNSPSDLKQFLESNGMAMQKKFGQNFMVNPNARSHIADLLEIREGESIWEVGPGLGCMTEELLKRKADVTVFEIDRGFISFLPQFFSEYKENNKFRIVEGDVLKTWKKHYEAYENKPVKLFGNLPYNIAATFIADTITYGLKFEKCVFTVQKEVAQRMAAKAGSDGYSAFSVLCQWEYDVKTDIELGSGNFWPRPNVASQTVVFNRKVNPVECSNPVLFVKLVHALFSSRRKTIQNNIKPLVNSSINLEQLFASVDLSPSERAENLTVEKFIQLSNSLDCARIKN